jgi:hypothetical protein
METILLNSIIGLLSVQIYRTTDVNTYTGYDEMRVYEYHLTVAPHL